VSEVGLVLDTSAVLAYAHGSELVGESIAKAADVKLHALVPALCLAEAYRRIDTDGWSYVDILAMLPNVVVVPVQHGDCPFVGGWARALGSLDLAQATYETASNPLVPLMTAHRDLVGRVLPKQWPIIDVEPN
jgi:hypothetical protein